MKGRDIIFLPKGLHLCHKCGSLAISKCMECAPRSPLGKVTCQYCKKLFISMRMGTNLDRRSCYDCHQAILLKGKLARRGNAS